MRWITGILVLLLAGCATTTPKMTAVPTDQEIAACHEEAYATKTSPVIKGLIWASNIVVIPASLGMLVAYPTDDSNPARRDAFYRSCMERLGYLSLPTLK